ncbi:hypothetical protein D3C84_573140 [compost metagenome]
MDEYFDIHPFAVGVQGIGHHLADRNLAVVNRRADVQRTEVLGIEREALARFAIGDGRRVFQSREVLRTGVGLTDVGADVVPGEQGIDTRNPAGADTRAHHPELRVLAGETFRLLGQFDGGVDTLLIGAQFHVGHHADHHIAVFDLGLVGRQAAAGLERNGDGRSFLHDRVHHQ